MQKMHSNFSNLLIKSSLAERIYKNICKQLLVQKSQPLRYDYKKNMESVYCNVIYPLFEDHCKNWQQLLFDDNIETIDNVTLQIFTTGLWGPKSPLQNNILIPHEFNDHLTSLQKTYRSKNPFRRLNVDVNLGEAEITIMFPNSIEQTMIVSSLQMLILNMFNDKKMIKTIEIYSALLKKSSNSEQRNIVAIHLLSLAHPKVNILKRTPNVKDIKLQDVFCLNPNFTSILGTFRVPLLLLKKIHYNI